ncbi:MAG TPA: hypothetical protein EYO20_07270 [Gemmatimonadetes bacterium]|jgi:iron complex transport system substrate-binding protein|nr:hypothetical protein [Gemmatimonadota bacterium]
MRIRMGWEQIRKLIFCITVLTTACQSAPTDRYRDTANNILLVDATGLEVTLQEPARRIISLVPSATQILKALGVGHVLVGRTDFDNEDWVISVPSLGGGLAPNFEKIIALNPDLVVLFAGDQDPHTRSRLDDFGLTQVAIRPDRLTDLYASIILLGQATGTEPVADSIISTIKKDLTDLQRWTATRPTIRTVYLLGGSPPWVAGPDTYIDEILRLAGGRNVFSDLEFLYGSVSPEQIRSREIDVVLVSDRSQFDAMLTPGARIEEIGNTLEFPGPNVAQAARHVAELLHRDLLR